MIFSFRSSLAAILATLALAVSGTAGAAVVLSTDFNGRTISGATASNLTWTTNGVVNPGNLTAVAGTPSIASPPPMTLFSTAAAANRFAVNRNIQNESPWYVDIPLQILDGVYVELGMVTLDAFIFDNNGNLQGPNRDLDMTLALLSSSLSVIDSFSVLDIYPNAGTLSPAQPRAVSFDLFGNTLVAGGLYYLRLTASSNQTIGNNAGIDNLVVNGQVVPEPGVLALLGVALAGLGMARSRRARSSHASR